MIFSLHIFKPIILAERQNTKERAVTSMSKRLTAIFEIGLTQVKSHTETHSEIRITKVLFVVKICE